MTDYQPGEIVDITLRGARVSFTHGGRTSFVVADEGDQTYFSPTPGSDAVSITRRVPADGVPRPGDIWTDRHGGLWFAVGSGRRSSGLRDDVQLVSQDPAANLLESWESVHRDSGPITLHWRGSPTPEQVARAALTPDAEVA